jgi:hypothetical protein
VSTLADEVLAEARDQAGLEDFGPDSFEEGLHVFAESLGQAQLNELGHLAVRANMVGGLVNRLRVADWRAQHPEVAAAPVEAPVMVIGMFRGGTSFLSNLLATDPTNRSLLRWESADSVPPPTPAMLHQGPRVEAARAANDMLEALNPKLAAVHHEEPDGATECITLMSQEFKSLLWEAIANVPDYHAWLMGADQVSAYEYHRDVLQVLQSAGAGGRWTLKSPHHAIALDALTTVYPDAQLVLLHRDPVVLCASVCSLISTLSGTFSDADHTAYIAEHWTALLEDSKTRIDAFRDAHPEHPIIDVAYADLVEQPVDTVGRLYDALGAPLSIEASEALGAYVGATPKGKFGEHHYDLATFGLEEGALRERFAGYIERYGVVAERGAS